MSDVIVITGTRKGIGRYLAEYYLERGHRVAGCSRGASDLRHERYEHHCLDVADDRALSQMVRSVVRPPGRPSIGRRAPPPPRLGDGPGIGSAPPNAGGIVPIRSTAFVVAIRRVPSASRMTPWSPKMMSAPGPPVS